MQVIPTYYLGSLIYKFKLLSGIFIFNILKLDDKYIFLDQKLKYWGQNILLNI